MCLRCHPDGIWSMARVLSSARRHPSGREELPHVYQNHEPGYDFHQMHFCAVCNGYYGISHNFDHEEHMARWIAPRGCACRGHRDRDGLPRQGDFGWIIDEQEARP